MNKTKLITLTIMILGSVFILSLKLTKLSPLIKQYQMGTSKELAKKYMILIEVEDCRLYLLENGTCIKKYLVGVGKPSTPTPLGFFKIVHKDTWGEGFGGRWLGFNVPWGKYGIHGTIFPNSIGRHLSQGCIRMWNKDVKELYNIVPIGTPVLIVNGPYGPFGQRLRTLNPGDTGADVQEVQRKLKELGFYKWNIDGKFGPALEGSLYKFQKNKGLPKRNKISKQEYDAMGIIEFE